MPFMAELAACLALLKLLVMSLAIFAELALAELAAAVSSDVTLLDSPLAALLALDCMAVRFELTLLFIVVAALVALAWAFCILVDTPDDKLSAWLTASRFILDVAVFTPLAIACA